MLASQRSLLVNRCSALHRRSLTAGFHPIRGQRDTQEAGGFVSAELLSLLSLAPNAVTTAGIIKAAAGSGSITPAEKKPETSRDDRAAICSHQQREGGTVDKQEMGGNAGNEERRRTARDEEEGDGEE